MPGGLRLAPGSIGGALTSGSRCDRRRLDDRQAAPRVRDTGRDRLSEPRHAAVRRDRLRLRGGRSRPDEPGPPGARDGGTDADRRSGILDIESLAERPPRRLSGGQAQLVVIASLLAMRPAHLVLDEPTAQLDPEGTRLVGEGLRELARTGTALLVVEHKTDLLDGLCERVAVIDDGRIALDGPADAVLADPRLEALGR